VADILTLFEPDTSNVLKTEGVMTHHRRPANVGWVPPLEAFCALLALAIGAPASDHRGALTEEFHQTYAITFPTAVLSSTNINGPVHISSWDRNEVKVDAVKYADTKERLDEAKIEIESGKDYVSIRTRYPDHNNNWNWGSHNNPAKRGVHTVTVPRAARLDEIKLINGAPRHHWRFRGGACFLHQRAPPGARFVRTRQTGDDQTDGWMRAFFATLRTGH